MTNTNSLVWCIFLVCLLSSVSPTRAEDHNNGTKIIKADEDLATYCVAKSFGYDTESMSAALSWTCGQVDCALLQPGKACFEPDNLQAHASFAFNIYYQKKNRINGSCNFNGTAMVTSTDPTHGACTFLDYDPELGRSSVTRLRCGSFLALVLLFLQVY